MLAVTGSDVNYALQLQLSDVDMSVAADTLGLTAVTPSMATADLQLALSAGGSHQETMSGTASLTVPAAQCTAVQYVCVVLSEGVGASYTDADNSSVSNVMCEDISARKSCAPGI